MVKMRIKTIQTGFSSGEVGEALKGGFDNELYYKGAEKLRNVYVNPQQHLTRREGSKNVDNTHENAVGRLIDFEFKAIQKYLLVFTPGRLKVYKDDVLQATVTTSPISALTATQIKEMDFTQSAGELLLLHKDFKTIKITRTNDTTWVVSEITYKNIPWYAFSGLTVITPNGHLTPDGTSGRDVLFTAQQTVFNANYVGQYIYNKRGGIARITSYISTTQVKCRIEVDFPNTNNILEGNWEIETGYEPSWSTTRGWPSCGAFHQNRLWLGNSGQRSEAIWGSVVGDYFNFDIGSSADDDAIDFNIEDNVVQYIVSGRNLQIYTTGGEYFVPTNVGDPITPSKLLIPKATSHGVKKIKPRAIGGVSVFVEASGRVVREFVYNDLEQNYNAKNISILSPHLIVDPVSVAVRQSRANSPADYFYSVNSDGTMAVLNVARDQELLAWSLFETQGLYEDVCVIGEDVYTIVKRTINNVEVRFIEKLSYDHNFDCSKIQISQTATTSWSNLSYLNGQEVNVKGDGFILQKATVASGNLTSSQAVVKLEAGLPFLIRVKLLPVHTQINSQSVAGDFKRVAFVNLLLLNSRHLVIKIGDKKFVPFFDRFGSNVLNSPAKTYTGWKKIFLSGVGRDTNIEITQDEPLEFNLLAVTIAIK